MTENPYGTSSPPPSPPPLSGPSPEGGGPGPWPGPWPPGPGPPPPSPPFEQQWGRGHGGGRRAGGRGLPGVDPTKWGAGYTVEGAPNWWTGRAPTGQAMTPTAAYAAVVNSMIPFLSPEDQRSTANNLARMLPEVFGSYADVGASNVGIPTGISSELRETYTSAERAEGMLASLEAMRAASTYEEQAFGPGFTYFENLANILSDYGGEEGSPQTRQQYIQLMAALDPIMGELQGEAMAAFGPAAQAITQPFFSAGSLVPVTQLPDGSWTFGESNVALF